MTAPRKVIDSDYYSGISPCLYWSVDDVANWIEDIGFARYKNCFKDNFVTGRKLIAVNCSSLPSMGVTDFQDMKKLSAEIRELQDIPKLHPNKAVAMRDPKVAYLELKRKTGRIMDNSTYKSFYHRHRDFFELRK